MNIWRYFVRQGRKEYSARARLAAMACESLLFVFGIPAFLFWSAAVGSDRWRFQLATPLRVASCMVAALGLSLGLWTVWVQFRHARGTPVPVMATKKLLTDRPYSICRNPMALGTLMFYFGLALCTQSFKPVGEVLLFAFCLITYIKLIEEREVSLRFGDEYSAYKQRTTFLIPRLPFPRAKPQTPIAATHPPQQEG
jgi:protein-S-isoprenylcysteine O-methyltransferase Ste14